MTAHGSGEQPLQRIPSIPLYYYQKKITDIRKARARALLNPHLSLIPLYYNTIYYIYTLIIPTAEARSA